MGNWTKTHLPCPDKEGCGSSDGAAISADDGSIHCFACGQHFMNTDNKPDPLAGYGSSRMDAAETRRNPCQLAPIASFRRTSVNQPVGCRPPIGCTAAGQLFAHIKDQQRRNCNAHPDTAQADQLEGFTQTPNCLVSTWRWLHLIITEGEIDAMVHEAYCARTKGVVAVSITSGVNLPQQPEGQPQIHQQL